MLLVKVVEVVLVEAVVRPVVLVLVSLGKVQMPVTWNGKGLEFCLNKWVIILSRKPVKLL